MVDARSIGRRGTRLAQAIVGLALAAPTSALAAPDPDLSAWVTRTTDLNIAQVALVSADSVYTLEPLGAPLPTGEIIVLVRTEPRADDWSAAHGFQSWDANLIIDCAQRRMRVIRSATYPQRNRGGKPTPEALDNEAKAPRRPEPAAQLLAAACDRDFAWPLRTQTATRLMLMTARDSAVAPAAAAETAPKPLALRPPETITLQPAATAGAPPSPTLAASSAPVSSPLAAPATRWVLQVARGVSEDGARRTGAAAMKALGAGARDLTTWTQVTTSFGDQPVHAALLGAFPSYVAADGACQTLRRVRQDCQVRTDPRAVAVAAANALPAEAAPRMAPAAPPTPATPGAAGPYAIQVARGPSEDGARWALARARKALGPLALGLRDALPTSTIPGDHIRYDVRLEGFATVDAAGEACRKLTAAGQSCFLRLPPPPALPDAQAAAGGTAQPG